MGKTTSHKEIPYERVLFFTDAVVAIAITLLALDLRLDLPANHKLVFADLLTPWKSYVAFLLSFLNIAGFWQTHHRMYSHIGKMNESSIRLNVAWLFFIIVLPFATSVLSTHFGESPAIFLYSLNIFLISLVQNILWDSADRKHDYINTEKISEEERSRFRLMFNLDMINGIIAIVLSFFYPTIAFVFLFFKIPMFLFGAIYIARLRKGERKQKALSEEEEAKSEK
jgi:uncharacterized membrane protein